MMTTSLENSNGLWQQLAGGNMPVVAIAAFALAAFVAVINWRFRARSARRLRAAAAAYAERDIVRQKQLNTSGCPA